MKKLLILLLSVMVIFNSCQHTHQKEYQIKSVPIFNHSYGNTHEITLYHLHLNVKVDFNDKSLTGEAIWDFSSTDSAQEIIFDVRHMDVTGVTLNGVEAVFWVGQEDSIHGSPLFIPLTKGAQKVGIRYKTRPEAAALQWMSGQMTEGKPFLFTQSQAILARTWVPCMDAPSVRFTYSADVECPNDLLPLMSATNPQQKNKNGKYHFEMKQPIPSYLLALCIGDLYYHAYDDRSGVYAQKGILDAAVQEFDQLPSMMSSAEKCYGPYQWERYDVVVLPSSFPFGGMENPRLTFATPTIITGDKSLVSLIAHELAHSWSGNLVTNHTWNDFWLNEGFTVYFEDRIMEEIYGRPYADMLAKIGLMELKETVEKLLETHPDDTRLYLNLEGRNPDEGVSDIAYEKGRFFLLSLEHLVGRDSFDAFLKTYFNTFAFKTITTEQFIDFCYTHLLNKAELAVKSRMREWIYERGLPDNCPDMYSAYLTDIDRHIASIVQQHGRLTPNPKGNPNSPKIPYLNQIPHDQWTTHHVLYFLRSLPPDLIYEHRSEIDAHFGFTGTANSEIACDWYRLMVEAGEMKSKPEIASFLTRVGRRKFLTPIYKAMMKNPEWVPFAREVFEKAGPGYHAVTYGTIQQIVYP
jgi:leukotriene-A4 hydrolase